MLAREKYLSLMIEAGSRVNWSALESGVADKIFFYYAPKILGGTQSIPVAGGTGRRRRADAIQFRDVKLHSIATESSPWRPGWSARTDVHRHRRGAGYSRGGGYEVRGALF